MNCREPAFYKEKVKKEERKKFKDIGINLI
jgi:hypothetical protein